MKVGDKVEFIGWVGDVSVTERELPVGSVFTITRIDPASQWPYQAGEDAEGDSYWFLEKELRPAKDYYLRLFKKYYEAKV